MLIKASLRLRVVLTLLPLLALPILLGGTAVVLLYRLGDSIDAILHENYDSVLYMERLNEALERVDSSFQFALAGREDKARKQYAPNWKAFDDNLSKEQGNITLPGEAEETERLTALAQRYRAQGDAFYARPARATQRSEDYFGAGGLSDTFEEIKDASGKILRMNQDNMEQASRAARRIARDSIAGFGMGLGVTALLAVWLVSRVVGTIVRPLRALTASAQAIGGGNLDQLVPVTSGDELGLLADSFNAMARQLRHYRQTDYSRLLRAQRTGQATIDAFPDPLLVLDGARQVEMANPAAERFLGVVGRKGDRPSLPWEPPDTLRQPLQDALERQQAYLPDDFERVVVLRLDGEERFFLPRCLPIDDPYGNTLGAAVLLQDVTRFRLLDQVKSDLVATVSHELKTPLTSIRLALHLLLEEKVGPLADKQTELLLDARDNAERLLDMVNHMLDLARLEQGRHLELKPHKPVDVLRDAADRLRPRAEDRDVALTVETPEELPFIQVDEQRLGHALNNLLDNALTYSHAGGQITLSAAAEAGEVVLSVADTGQGIAAEFVPHVFDRFFRIPGQSEAGGSGLGLAIVREIVTAHGGRIRCESTPGMGTTFRIYLPATPGTASVEP